MCTDHLLEGIEHPKIHTTVYNYYQYESDREFSFFPEKLEKGGCHRVKEQYRVLCVMKNETIDSAVELKENRLVCNMFPLHVICRAHVGVVIAEN